MNVLLNNGHTMPMIGLGMYDMHGQEAERAIVRAIEIGYRLIDTASMYQNESELGNAWQRSGLKREDIFITTKVNNSDQGYDQTLKALEVSLAKLNTDYVDLYLLHWPLKLTRKQTWKAMEKIWKEGRAKSIGVANFLIPFLNELYEYTEIIPAVNQVEFSPYLFLKDLLVHCQDKNIKMQAYSPLLRGLKLKDAKLVSIAAKYNRTTAQIKLRWCIQHGVCPIPKSVNPVRLLENFQVFDFQITEDDMRKLDSFNEGLRVVDDPLTML